MPYVRIISSVRSNVTLLHVHTDTSRLSLVLKEMQFHVCHFQCHIMSLTTLTLSVVRTKAHETETENLDKNSV